MEIKTEMTILGSTAACHWDTLKGAAPKMALHLVKQNCTAQNCSYF
jgi:hypothetical protein